MAITHLFTGTAAKGARRSGRGISAGQGKTAGRGTKGQKSRAGAGRKIKAWFEGGQTPVIRKLARHRGEVRPSYKAKKLTLTTDVVNFYYRDGEVVSPTTLVEKNVIRASARKLPIKVVLRTPLKIKVTFDGVKLSTSLGPSQTPAKPLE